MVMWKKKKPNEGDFGSDDEDMFAGRDPFMHSFTFRMDDIEKMMENMLGPDFRRMAEEMSRDMERQMRDAPREPGKPVRVTRGFSIKMGPDGKVNIEQFGNTGNAGKQVASGGPSLREPLVDVIDKEKIITILAEMPGVEKKEIDVSLSQDGMAVIIEVPGKFYKETPLPAKVKRQGQKAC